MLDDLENQLLRLVANAVQRRLIDLHTALPGIVEKHYPDKCAADIKIAIKRKLSNTETVESIQVLPEVPVIQPMTSAGGQYQPLASGDQVLLIFCERSLEDFKIKGGSVEPATVPRFFSYSDAVAIPGFWHQTKCLNHFAGNLKDTSSFIYYAGGFIGIDEAGKIYLGRSDGTIDEPLVLGNVLGEAWASFSANVGTLIDHVKTLVSDISAGPIGIGNLGSPVPTHPSLIPKLEALGLELDTLKSALESDVSKYVDTASTNFVSQIAFTERGA